MDKKLIGFVGNEKKCSCDIFGSGGAKEMSQAQMDAYQKAKLVISEKNGADVEGAKKILEGAGMEVFYA